MSCRFQKFCAPAMAVSLALALLPAAEAATENTGRLRDVDPQKLANGVLAVMSFSVVPDLTSSFLSIDNAVTENPSMRMTQFGGGFTWSADLPLYLEGSAAINRYDPKFIASNGEDQRTIPLKWNSAAVTGGVGWDFALTEDRELKLRPIFNFSLGYVASDLRIAEFLVERYLDRDIDFLSGGQLNAYGLGGSLMLDYEHYRADYEIDVELRYTNVQLKSYGDTARSVEGRADAEAANLWARWRAPTGLMLFDRPLRYVLEFSHSNYLGSQADVLGFDDLSSIGAGIEFDTSSKDIWITRTRLVLRHVLSQNVEGTALGIAVSF